MNNISIPMWVCVLAGIFLAGCYFLYIDSKNKIYFPRSDDQRKLLRDIPNLSWKQITQHYAPDGDIEEWRKILIEKRQWRKGYSAYQLAHSWKDANPHLPREIAKLFDGSTKLLVATPEHETPLLGRGLPSQSDILAFVQVNGKVCAVAVEGKVDEPFGSESVGEWLGDGTPNKNKRLNGILQKLGAESPPGDIRYQLLHRTASAVIEAENFHADCAVMIVHSFSETHKRFDDFVRFLNYLGISGVERGKLYRSNQSSVPLWLGWATPKQGVFASAMRQTKMYRGWITIVVGFALSIICFFWRSNSKGKATADIETSNQRKGREFEEYVASLFEQSEGIELLTPADKHGFPDYEATITDNDGEEHKFSLECKFRGSFYFGMFQIVKSDYIQKCKKYQKSKNNRPFYLVVGVKNPSSNPRYMYVVPLEKLPEIKLDFKQLNPYLQTKNGKSTYSPRKRALKISR